MIVFIFLAILVILTSIFNAVLGIVALTRNPRRADNRAFFGLTILVAIWILANFFGSVVQQERLAFWLVYTDFAVGFLMATAFMLFADSLGYRLIRRVNLPAIAIPLAVVMAALVYLRQVVTLQLVPNGVEVKSAALEVVYDPLIFGSIIAGFVFLIIKRKRSVGVIKAQVSIVLYGFVAMLGLAAAANLVLPKLVDNIEIQNAAQRLAYLGFVGFSVLTTYAMARHRLFDVRWVVARSVAYVLLLATLAIIYSFAIFTTSQLFFVQPQLTAQQTAIFVILAVTLAFMFHPLRRFFEKLTDRVLFRDRYETQVVLNNIGNILAVERLLDDLLGHSLRELCRQMRIGGGQFVVVDDKKVYREVHYGPAEHRPDGGELIEVIRSRMVVADELEPGHLKDLLDEHSVRVSLMLWTQGEQVGFLFLGEKLSGEIYSRQDLDLLEILRKELAVAVVNAKAYQEIANFNITLQGKVRDATARLRTANTKLKALDKAKDDFISMASHQLGTPLTAITGFLNMTLDDDKHNMTARQRERVTYALEAADRLVGMAADLLDVSRINSGRFFIQREPLNLSQLIEEEIAQLHPVAQRKGLILSYTKPDHPIPFLLLDKPKTHQVIMNFIDNAIYYTDKGRIVVTLKAEGKMAELLVTDTGMGVPAAEQKKLFAKFFRADNAKSVRPDGTGLGLYLAKRVIEDQGGELVFRSVEGEGSTFGFRFPLPHD